ncbi:MAG: hypothetical protein PVH05_12385 [Burkholderiales bacterium]|jgi:hypothetical protein
MSFFNHHQSWNCADIEADTMPPKPVRDSSGYVIFSEGETGAMHAMAHRMLDSGQIIRGHQLLGEWLANRIGSGSEWIHLQWHMAILEVSLGHWQFAFARFRQHILPAVVTSYDALTDAPAFLWRLSLEAGKHRCLPWQPVRMRALSSLQETSSPFISAHNILALAGAGDTANLDKWIQSKTQQTISRAEAVVIRIARGLRAYISGNYAQAAEELAGIASQMPGIGGSRAQNELFTKLHESAQRKAAGVWPAIAQAA